MVKNPVYSRLSANKEHIIMAKKGEATPDSIHVHKVKLPDGIEVSNAMFLLDNQVKDEIHHYVKKHSLGGTEDDYDMMINTTVLNGNKVVESYAKNIKETGVVTIFRKSDAVTSLPAMGIHPKN